MNENRYMPSLEAMWKIGKGMIPDRPTKRDLTNFALASVETMYDLSNPIATEVFGDYFATRGVFSEEQRALSLSEGKANATMIALSEVMSIFDSVCLHVKDKELVEALVRSDIDAVAGDARLPFPIMELVYPEGVMISDRCQASGTLVVDYRAANFKKWFGGITDIQSRGEAEGRLPAQYLVITRMRLANGTYDGSSLIKKFDEKFDMNYGLNPPDVTQEEIAGLDAHVRLAWAVFLYLQSVDRDKAMPLNLDRHNVSGVPAKIARMFKSQKHYSIIDVVKPARPHKSEPLGGTHASPVTHWRIGHIRTLRNERFSRNQDGSLRTKWIRPVKVMAEAEGAQPSERKLD